MILPYVLIARGLVTVSEATCERRAVRLARSLIMAVIACFSGGTALLVVAVDLTAALKPACACSVFISWACSAVMFGATGADRYTAASSRSASTWASRFPVGVPMVSFSVLDLARLIASLAVMVAAKAYSPIRDRTGMTTRRKILMRMDQRRKPMMCLGVRCDRRTAAVTRGISQEEL